MKYTQYDPPPEEIARMKAIPKAEHMAYMLARNDAPLKQTPGRKRTNKACQSKQSD